MRRRDFMKASSLAGVAALLPAEAAARQGAPAIAKREPIRMFFGGYGPASTGFSLAMKKIGDRLVAKFGRDR